MLVLGADHGGFALKEYLKRVLLKGGHVIHDVGSATLRPADDYPIIAAEVAKLVRRTTGGRGILLCGSGVGMSVVANKFAGIRAVNAWDTKVVIRARKEEDANILVLPAHFVSRANAEKIVQAWLVTPFQRIPRYRRRLGEIARIENTN
ncbi:MAG: RpiB/LacA/LacB family sugar-phosphate isomerase [Patescibacteria group bacterium]